MKKFISKIRNLSERAEELQAAIKSAPPRFAELRDSVALTRDQLLQLRSEVEAGILDLKTDDEVQLIDSLREINASIPVLQQAGYELSGVDVELSPVQRVLAHLHRVEDVSVSILQSLLSASSQRKLTHALLAALIQAEAMADEVDLENLVYFKLMVTVGPIPAVRLCWQSEDEAFVAEQRAPTSPPSVPAPGASSLGESYGKDSFFERSPAPRSEAARLPSAEKDAAGPSNPMASPAGVVTSAPSVAAAKGGISQSRPGRKDWSSASLERFKTMPHESKYKRRYTGD
jgi:hypothetical protein